MSKHIDCSPYNLSVKRVFSANGEALPGLQILEPKPLCHQTINAIRPLAFPSSHKAAKPVLLALAAFRNHETGHCFPGVEKIAEALQFSISTVYAALKFLRDTGIITDTIVRYDGKDLPGFEITVADAPEAPTTPVTGRKTPATGPKLPATGIAYKDSKPEPKPEHKPGGPRPTASEARARQSSSTDLVEIEIARPAHRLPPSWQPKVHHVDKVEARCRAVMTRSGPLQLLAERQPGWDDFTREFAERFTAEKAQEMRAWDQKARHRNEDWDMRFDAWLDTEFRHLARDKVKPFITVDGKPVSLGDGMSRAVKRSFAESAASMREDPDYEIKIAEAARKAAQKAAENAEYERQRTLSDEERQAEHAAEKRRTDMKWWADRASGFRMTLSPEKFDTWLRNVPMPDMLPDWCQALLAART